MAGENRKKVLAIDDERLIGMTIERALRKIGYPVVMATDRKSFIEALEQGPFALAIIDLHMADITVDEIRSGVLQGNPSALFLVVSGSDYEGPEDYLPKPFMVDELRKKVRSLLGDAP